MQMIKLMIKLSTYITSWRARERMDAKGGISLHQNRFKLFKRTAAPLPPPTKTIKQKTSKTHSIVKQFGEKRSFKCEKE